MRHVLLYTDEDGNWIAEVPSLPGCGSDGTTREEALANVKEAIRGYFLLDGRAVDDEGPMNNVEIVEVPEAR